MLASDEALHATMSFSPTSNEIGSIFTYRGANSFQLTNRILGQMVSLLLDMHAVNTFLGLWN
jgi:hypothetical protein